MTGEQLATWRNNRGLSQDALAERLGWTRQQLANVETERTTMKENIEHRLAMVDESLQRSPAPNAKQTAKPRYDWSNHRCWSLRGVPVSMAMVLAKGLGCEFYRLDSTKNKDPLNGHLLANLCKVTQSHPNGDCRNLALDLDAWQVVCLAYPDHPKTLELLPKLNAMLGDKPVDNSPAENKFSFFA